VNNVGGVLLLVVGAVIILNLPGLGGKACAPGAATCTGAPITLWQKIFNSSGYSGGY